MSAVNVNDFTDQKECTYDEEFYSVRDNGAILRHPQVNGRKRSADDTWTFGKINSSNPYLYIANVRVHRIVATAFHGDPPDPKYVVDHIDSNCRNNRPENLRWLTRLENSLQNPVTRKKIEYLCGSVEAFLNNPSMLNSMHLEPNISWMRTVTPEEARNCKMRMSIWANSKKKSIRSSIARRSSFGDRIYKPLQKWELGREPGLYPANTPGCGQYMWKGSSYFPCCPEGVTINPLESYFQNLKVGIVFSYSDDVGFSSKMKIVEFEKTNDNSSILVMCTGSNPEQYTISGITICNKGFFIHVNLGSYPDKDSAEKAFCAKRELTDLWSDAYKWSLRAENTRCIKRVMPH